MGREPDSPKMAPLDCIYLPTDGGGVNGMGASIQPCIGSRFLLIDTLVAPS